MPGLSAIERSQKKLYLAVKSELAPYETQKSKELLAYERSFQRSLPKHPRATSKADLLNSLCKSRVGLVGDFHPFRQSQKGFLRLLEECRPKVKRITIALECFQQAHQSALNEYLSGLITVEEFRDKIDFERYWPFSWENYKEILTYARKHKISVLALNVFGTEKKRGSLKERDKAAAERIARELHELKTSLVLCLYGELHLGRSHLPRELKNRLGLTAKVFVIHQNNTDLYWKAPSQGIGQKAEVLRLSRTEYCILNSVPWVKLRSYLDWLEGDSSAEDWSEQHDVSGMVHHYSGLLAEALGFQTRARDEVEVFGPDRLSSATLGKLLKGSSKTDRLLADHALLYKRTSYLPDLAVILLPTVSTNSLSEAASFLLWHSEKPKPLKQGRLTLQQGIAHFLIGYAGSKVLNPKRKCNEEPDLKEWQAAIHVRRRTNAPPHRALKLLSAFFSGNLARKKSSLIESKTELESCRLAGYILGERLFLSLLADPHQLSLLRAWYQCVSLDTNQELLTKTSIAINRLATVPSSKKEKF